jgi:hypothetical protein
MKWSRRQRARGSGHSIFLLSSVLAVLALASAPVLAQAGSAGPQYNTGINGAGGQPEGKEKIAKKSESPPTNGGASAPANPGSVSPESGGNAYTEAPSSGSGGGGGVTAAQKNDAGTGQGKPEQGSTPGGNANVQHVAPAASKSTASDDDGSSPLLPILIGILVLAAISVAAYVVRQRRQRDAADPTLSTKVG